VLFDAILVDTLLEDVAAQPAAVKLVVA